MRNESLTPGAAPAKADHADRYKPGAALDDTLAFKSVVGDMVVDDQLLRLICERVKAAAEHLELSRADLFKIFGRYSMFEGEAAALVEGKVRKFLIVEAHHLLAGKVGKGALKLMFPKDLVWEGANFVTVSPGVVEVLPPPPKLRWYGREEAWEAVACFLRELITGETLSMSLKSQSTGAPFAGSEGVILCALDEFEPDTGRFFLRSALRNTDLDAERDKELLESIVNSTAEVLTRAGRIAHDRIVHAAETNSTLTARLDLQLPTNVVEGHLRALLQTDPNLLIGDEDMTCRLRRMLARRGYRPTECALAKEAARMQLQHAILTLGTRERLRGVLAEMPEEGFPMPEQFRALVGIFFGAGETQQTEDQIFHHREPILAALAAALSVGRLDDCDDPRVLNLYLRVLLDNQEKLMKASLLRRMPAHEALSVDWLETLPLLSEPQEAELTALLPAPDAGKTAVKRSFARVLALLTGARDAAAAQAEDPFMAARRDVLEHAIRVITTGSGVVPCVQRIRYFVTPFTNECVTPKLGVITRKPRAVCGSELRPEAMAEGALAAVEVLRRMLGASRDKPLEGLSVAIQGLGNAGKVFARRIRERGGRVVAVSDSRGAVVAEDGFDDGTLEAILRHKDAGRSLDTLARLAPTIGPGGAGGCRWSRHGDPNALKDVVADLLVLTAMPGAVQAEDAERLQVKMICELTGAAVTGQARRVLRQRGIPVVPDNLGSSGGLLVSLSEMLQNALGQQWDRELEITVLQQQIEQSHAAIQHAAEQYGVDLASASDILALQRIRALAIYREKLEAAAQQLKQRIQSIGDGETIIIASDNDDDGVASAAMMHGLIAWLNPGRERQVLHVNESLRSRALLGLLEAHGRVRQVFMLDRAFPLSLSGQQIAEELARRCTFTLINNHDLPAYLVSPDPVTPRAAGSHGVKAPEDLGILLISPQSLGSTIPARHLTTSLLLKALVHQLVPECPARLRLDWQAAIGSWLDVSPEKNSEWLLFSTQFNPDQMTEAARAIRMVSRARDFLGAIRALVGVERPDQLETNAAWEKFLETYRLLADRVQLLVEKIGMETVGRPCVSHFFTSAEVEFPLPGDEAGDLDLYPWISEHLTRRADFAEKPVIVGQVVGDLPEERLLGVRIRSPRDVDLMEAGLPEEFRTGGLPNTAVASFALDPALTPEQQFQQLVEEIWWMTVSPTVRLTRRVGAPAPATPSPPPGRQP